MQLLAVHCIAHTLPEKAPIGPENMDRWVVKQPHRIAQIAQFVNEDPSYYKATVIRSVAVLII